MTTIQSICDHYGIPVADTIAAFNNAAIKWLAVVVWVIMLCLFKKKYYIYTSGILLHSQYGVYEQLKIDMFRYIIGFVGSSFKCGAKGPESTEK